MGEAEVVGMEVVAVEEVVLVLNDVNGILDNSYISVNKLVRILEPILFSLVFVY